MQKNKDEFTASNEQAEERNGIPATTKKRHYKSFSDAFGDGAFYPDLPKIPFTDLLNIQVVVVEAKILKDFTTQFGKHDCALMLCFPLDKGDSEKFTTICSGQVVVERIDQAIKRRLLPMVATPSFIDEKYYNLL